MAARVDTDHTTGAGQVAITGRYDSKKDSFGVDAAYTVDDSNTIYGSYGVTDEKIISLGLESGFTAFGRRNTVDMVYHPPNDSAMMKFAIRQGKTKVAAYFSFDDFKETNVKSHSERYELDARLSGVESLKMTFDGKTKASKVKVSRKLDPKNKLDAEYHYLSASTKYVSLTFKHQYSKIHAFSVTTNYGARKYKVEWDCKTENGPWTVSTAFPFNVRCVKAYSLFRKLVTTFSVFSNLFPTPMFLLSICIVVRTGATAISSAVSSFEQCWHYTRLLS